QSLCDYFGIPFVNAGPVLNGVVVTDGSNLNIRSYPSTNSSIIGSIPNNADVTIYGSVNGWYVIFYNGITGYASSDFIVI
ncbi:MAG TPA: peptidoglycan hydrolase, partial [Ruminococcus sp.]|nr:peptidoglycan hydrolase [Ruminococcus sp.]